MHVTIGRLPTAIVVALGGVDQGGGVYDVSAAVAALCRALGGAVSGGGATSRLLLESGDAWLLESVDHNLLESAS